MHYDDNSLTYLLTVSRAGKVSVNEIIASEFQCSFDVCHRLDGPVSDGHDELTVAT